MNQHHTVLHALDYVLPDEILSSDAIEDQLETTYQRLKLSKGRLEWMTGIKERRIWPIDTSPSTASAMAGMKVLENSNVNREDIDLLIHTSVSRDFLEPATASVVHKKLGLSQHTQVFDLSNACLGFLNGIMVISAMIESGQIKCGMLVSGENGRPLLERTIDILKSSTTTRSSMKPQLASLTIGCGAVAAILCHKDFNSGKAKFTASVSSSDSEHSDLCQGDRSSGHQLEMSTNSEALLKQGVSLAKSTWENFKQKSNWNSETPNLIVTHQVGHAHRRELYQQLQLNLEKDFSTFEQLGNIGSASLPITLAVAEEQNLIQSQHNIALLGIGSGINCMMLAMEWL